ncbi:hypothetical protein PIB30_073965 [Stylosanthes scabra]|uniref:Uncharacterized protein n=1 Tax=Stylosanthes scabra TaxID=79078 RepID=A0ABU6TR22_9FABA|nr:hypothetical protein [Stylosanthes scabra]
MEEMEEGEDEEDDEDKDWLYELLPKMVGVESSESEEECEEAEVDNMKKKEVFFIATVYGGTEEMPKELPEKCADPSSCIVAYKIEKKDETKGKDSVEEVGQKESEDGAEILQKKKGSSITPPVLKKKRKKESIKLVKKKKMPEGGKEGRFQGFDQKFEDDQQRTCQRRRYWSSLN